MSRVIIRFWGVSGWPPWVRLRGGLGWGSRVRLRGSVWAARRGCLRGCLRVFGGRIGWRGRVCGGAVAVPRLGPRLGACPGGAPGPLRATVRVCGAGCGISGLLRVSGAARRGRGVGRLWGRFSVCGACWCGFWGVPAVGRLPGWGAARLLAGVRGAGWPVACCVRAWGARGSSGRWGSAATGEGTGFCSGVCEAACPGWVPGVVLGVSGSPVWGCPDRVGGVFLPSSAHGSPCTRR